MAEPEEKKEQPKKSSKMKLIILLLIVVIALGGGGFFAYTKFFKKPKGEEAGHEKSQKTEKAQQAILYKMDTFLVNLADPGGKRYLKLTMELELDNKKVEEEITKETSRIRDVILTVLSSKTFDDISTLPGKQTLKKELMTKVNASLKNGKVTNIYFTEFLIQ
ncbi:MAG: flagellar basal body-associated FliL family protein [Thermodesulforhabdaceae bacterium]|jgi:flagellar FliL protein